MPQKILRQGEIQKGEVDNVFYQICTKSVPEEVDPFASLIVTINLK